MAWAVPDCTPSASSMMIVSNVLTKALSSSTSFLISSKLEESDNSASHLRNLSLDRFFVTLVYKQDSTILGKMLFS